MLRALTLFAPVMNQSVSPSHAGWTGATSGSPSAPTVATWAHGLSRAASRLTRSRSTRRTSASAKRPGAVTAAACSRLLGPCQGRDIDIDIDNGKWQELLL